MSFKQALVELGSNVAPNKILQDLLKNSPNVNESIALLLSEILIPNSQNISINLSLDQFPEANARGCQFKSIFSRVSAELSNVNWFEIFNFLNSFLPSTLESSQSFPTPLSITQFLSTLSDNQIDIFLSYNWWFNKYLFLGLFNLSPDKGGLDLLSLNLNRCFSPDVDQNINHSILSFVNIAKLELKLLDEDTQKDGTILAMFEQHYRQVPQYLAFAGVQLINDDAEKGKDRVNYFLEKLIFELIDINSVYLPYILKEFAIVNKFKLIQYLLNYYQTHLSYDNIMKIIQLAKSIDILQDIVDSELDTRLLLPIVVESNSNLENFISSKLVKSKKQTIMIILEFLESRSNADLDKDDPNSSPLNLQVVYYLLKVLKDNSSLISENDRVHHIQSICIQAYPRLINLGCGHDDAILIGGTVAFDSETEQQMKKYYQQMYNRDIEIKDIIQILSIFKGSDNPREQDIFACMIHSLLDEYRFFPEYPLEALATTSVLFGSMIYFRLIQSHALSIALRCILDSARQPTDSNMFKFAVQALYAFRSSLNQYPNYCRLLLEIEGLKSQVGLYNIIKEVADDSNSSASNVPAGLDGRVSAGAIDSSSLNKSSSVQKADLDKFRSIKADLNSSFETPSEEIQDKLSFLLNNTTMDNIKVKTQEYQDLLKEEYFNWFANHLVKERAKVEPNNHDLYALLVEKLNNNVLEKDILNVTYGQVIKILNTTDENASDRSHLRNLGGWLGSITLAKDKPIRRNNVSFKSLLIEAFDLQLLTSVIPFVCKVLDQSKNSKVFKLPNPWLLGILQVLVEIYEFANLSLNLRFEIEVLCNALKTELSKVQRSFILRNHQPGDYNDLIIDLTKLSLKPQVQFPQQVPQVQQTTQISLQQHQQQPILPPNYQQAPPTGAMEESLFSNIAGVTSFALNFTLKRLFQAALAKSVREILPPAMDRASSIALITTRSLVLKDFACELDERKLRVAAIQLVKRLSESLALATCRDPLKESIQNNTIALAPQYGNFDASHFEELNQAIHENIDYACKIIEKSTYEKAISEIDETLRQAYLIRRQHREQRIDQVFTAPHTSPYALQLPEPLGLKPHGLTSQQFQVYENFGRPANATSNFINKGFDEASTFQFQNVQNSHPVIGQAGNTANSAGVISSVGIQQPQAQTVSIPPQPQLQNNIQNVQQNIQLQTTEHSFIIIQQLLENLISSIGESEEAHLRDIKSESTLRRILDNIVALCAKISLREQQLLLKVAQYTVNALFTSCDSLLGCETLVFLLDKLCEMSPSTAKDVTWWLVHAEDERKFNSNVISALLRVSLVIASEFDTSLAKVILSGNESATTFACELIMECVMGPNPVALRSDFAASLDAIRTITENGVSNEAVNTLLSMMRSVYAPVLQSKEVKITLYEQMCYIFAEWSRLIQHGSKNDDLQAAFIQQLYNEKILTNPEFMNMFFKACFEISIKVYDAEGNIRQNTGHDFYYSADILSMLIVKIILAQEDDEKIKIRYLKQIFAILLIVFVGHQENNKEINNERAFFRIFSSLLSEWSTAYKLDKFISDELNVQFYLLIADVFSALQPLVFPSFTFAWISLISHRMFLPEILDIPNNEGWEKFINLIVHLLKFESNHIKSKEISEVILVISKGITRLFVLLLHDYPELLVQYHNDLVSVIPPSFVQLRNIVLSASPSAIVITDPFTQGLKVDRLPEINEEPIISSNPASDLLKANLKKPVDNYLRIPSHTLLKTILNGLKLCDPIEVGGIGYNKSNINVGLINSLVLYVGISAVSERGVNASSFNQKSSQVSLLSAIMQEGNLECQYQLIQAISNQLRYPNSHTHWFSCIILHFFGSQSMWGNKKMNVLHVITRVLLERIICNRPHPWGLLITFTELLKNSEYSFFELPFTKEHPELEHLFNSLLTHISASSSSASA